MRLAWRHRSFGVVWCREASETRAPVVEGCRRGMHVELPAVVRRLRMRRALILGVMTSLLLSVLGVVSPAAQAATLQTATPVSGPTLATGFSKLQLAGGWKNPIVFVFARNGDIYIGEQAGTILTYRNGAILPTPLGTIATDGTMERGLTGLALDPNYASNGYLYVSYTTTDDHSQLSRFTVQNGALNNASEVVYVRGNQLQNPHHPGNDLHAGPDGKLWWAVGDNVPSISNAQTLTNIYGKILRDELDGTGPSDNPFLNVPAAVAGSYPNDVLTPSHS